MSDIFSYIMGDVQDAVSRIKGQLEVVEGVSSAFKNGADKLEGVWTGAGADAFYDEVRTRLVPEITALIESIGGLNLNIGKAEEQITNCDQEVTKTVTTLADIYDQIQI